MVHHLPAIMATPPLFPPRRNFTTQLLHDNTINSIGLYSIIFVRGLFNILTGLHIITSLAAIAIMLLSRFSYKPASKLNRADYLKITLL